MRHVVLTLFLALMLTSVAALAASSPTPASVRQVLTENLTLGDSLQGQPVTAEAMTRIGRTVTQGVTEARALAAADPKSAEAHDLFGLFLIVAYLPAPVATGGLLLRRGSTSPAEVQQGLEALRTAAALRPGMAGYRLDYAWALLLTGQPESARAELRTIAGQTLSAPERARLRQLQAQAESGPGTPGPSAPKAITWLSFEEALQTAKQQNKQVLVDFMAEWCGWCKRMDSDVFPKPEVIALGQKYVFARVDAEKQPTLARQYKANGFPTFVAVDAQGKEVKRVIGYKSPQEFVRAFQ